MWRPHSERSESPSSRCRTLQVVGFTLTACAVEHSSPLLLCDISDGTSHQRSSSPAPPPFHSFTYQWHHWARVISLATCSISAARHTNAFIQQKCDRECECVSYARGRYLDPKDGKTNGEEGSLIE